MKKALRRVVALGIAATMLLNVACDTSEPEETGSTTTAAQTDAPDTGDTDGTGSEDTTSPDTNGEPNEYGWVVPEETIEFTVYAGYGDQEEFLADEDGGKEHMDAWLLENMNVKINWEFTGVDMVEQLNLMLVSNDYPDVITWMADDMANRFERQNKAIDLTDLLAEHGDNITRRLGDYMNFLYNEDGKIYKLAQYWGENPNVAGSDFGMRYDLWKELGDDDIYETPEEYVDAIQRVIANNPTNENGQQTYGFTSADQGQNFLRAMLGAYGFVNNYKVDDGDFKHWINTEEGYEIAKIVNDMYQNNLIDPDFLSNGYEEYVTKLSSGQVIGNLGTWWYAWTGGHEIWAVDEGEDYDIEKRIMNVSVSGEGVDMDETTLLTSNFIGSYRAIITDNAEDPEGIMKFINWQNSELGNYITGWGPPSETNVWDIAEDGTWRVDDAILDTDRKEVTFHNVRDAHGANAYPIAINMNWLKTDGLSNFDSIDPRIDRVSAYDYWPVEEDGSFSNDGINLSWQYYTAPAKDITLYQVTFDPNDQITITNQSITDAVVNEWAKIMTAEDDAQFEQAFEQAKAHLNALDLESLEAYYQAAYETNLEIFQQ